MKVVNIPLAELKPHPRNPRGHPAAQIEHLRASLCDYGWVRNVVVARDKTILAGHGIVEAARAEGLDTAPCEVVNLAPDDPKAEKFLALENTVSRLAQDDDTALAALLADVQRTVGLAGTGYDDAALDALIASVAESGDDAGIKGRMIEASIGEPPNTFVVACVRPSAMQEAGPLLDALSRVEGVTVGYGASGSA